MLLWLPRAALVKPERPLPWAPSALLAQLVEHLHGKEGVSGSSPEEGSAKTLCAATFLVDGDLHVFQRAVGMGPNHIVAVGDVLRGRLRSVLMQMLNVSP